MTSQAPEETARRILQQHYGIEQAELAVETGYMSSHALVRAEGQRWVLKMYGRGAAGVEAIEEAHRFIRFLSEQSYPAPAPVRSAHGKTLVVHEGRRCALFPFVQGDPFQPGNRRQLAAAGQALAELHRLASQYVPLHGSPRCALIEQVLADKSRELAAVRPSLDGALATELERTLQESQLLPRRAYGLPCVMIHGDFRAQNVLFHGDSVGAVIDFDSAAPAPRLVDLSYALVFFQAVLAPQPMTREERAVFLDSYARAQPLTRKERELLPAFLRFSWLRGMLLWARIAYVDRASDKAEGWMEAYRDLHEHFDGA